MLYNKRIRKDLRKRKEYKNKQFYIWKLKSLVNNKILPLRIRMKNRELLINFVKKHEIYQTQIINKCLFTGRSRGIIREFGISRIVFKNLVDKGELYWIKKV